MAEASTVNRRKESDICIVRCKEPNCYLKEYDVITKNLQDFKISQFVITDKTKKEDVYISLCRCVVAILLCCSHIVVTQEKFLRAYGEVIDTKCLVGYRKLTVSRFRHLKERAKRINNDVRLQEFITLIKTEIQRNVFYDDVGNLYAELDLSTSTGLESGYIQQCYSTEMASALTHNAVGSSTGDLQVNDIAYASSSVSSTNVKTLAAVHTNPICLSQCVDHFKTSSSCLHQTSRTAISEDQEGIYLDAATLHRSSVARGAHVLKAHVLPRDKYDLVPEDIVEYFNRSHDDDFLEDMTKYIVAVKGVSLLKSNNLLGLVILTKCRNRSIQVKILEVIDELLYTREILRCNVDEILKSMYVIQDNMSQYPGDHDLLCMMVHLLLTLLCILYLWILERGCDQGLRNRIETACNEINKVPKLESGDLVLDNLLKSLRSISTSMTKFTPNSTLKMGRWKDALSIEKNRVRMIEKMESFSELEKCSCMFGIANQMLSAHRVCNLDDLKFVDEAMKRVAKLDRKQKNTSLLPICVMMSKAVIRAASNQNRGTDNIITECRKKLMDILSLFLDSKCLGQLGRYYILAEIKPLLFHPDESVVKQALYLLHENNHKSPELLQMVVPHIEKTLFSLNLNITKTDDYEEKMHTPTWKVMSGRIANGFEVDIHVLWPTLDCIGKGSMHDYSKKADLHLTNYNTTHLDILHHLNESQSHCNIIKLLAYQTRPLPFFYITERIQGNDLSNFLLRRRKEKHWLSIQNVIILATGVLNAIIFLHSRAIIHRNLTANQFLVKNDDVPVLHDFGMSLRIKDDSSFATDERENLIPLRWSSPESILHNRFDQSTDKYMAGMLLYEMFTHGCQPFTELYNISIDSILEMILFQDLKPRQATCIPRQIHELILDLTSSDNVCTLEAGLIKLSDFLSKQKELNPRPSDSHNDDKRYPELDKNQGDPERVLPDYIRNFKVSGPNPRKSYFNLRMSQRKQRTVLQLQESELVSPEEPTITFQGLLVLVSENVNRAFIETVMPKLQRQNVVRDLRTFSQPQIDRKQDGISSLIYKCKKGENLIKFATRNPYGDPYDDRAEVKYVRVVYNLVNYVYKLHQRNFILRDICGKVIYLESNDIIHDENIYSIRLGRMLYLDKEHDLEECIIDEVFKERSNWLPIETLDNRLYSFESDVYMLCMTIHEFYVALDLHRGNPVPNMLRCVPFARVRRSQLREHLLRGEVPEQSDACPSWLYDEMKKCWNRDRTQRPSVKHLRDVIQAHLESPDVNTKREDAEDVLPLPCTGSSTEYYPDTDTSSMDETGRDHSYITQPVNFRKQRRFKSQYITRSVKYNPVFNTDNSESEKEYKDRTEIQETFNRNHSLRQSVRIQDVCSSTIHDSCREHTDPSDSSRVHCSVDSQDQNSTEAHTVTTVPVMELVQDTQINQLKGNLGAHAHFIKEDNSQHALCVKVSSTQNNLMDNSHVKGHDQCHKMDLKSINSSTHPPTSNQNVPTFISRSTSTDSYSSDISFANSTSDDDTVENTLVNKPFGNLIKQKIIEENTESLAKENTQPPTMPEPLGVQSNEEVLYLDVHQPIEFANNSTEVSEDEQIVRTNYLDNGDQYIDFDRDVDSDLYERVI